MITGGFSMACFTFCGSDVLWRDMHERYRKWNSIYVRFRRWAEQGVWDAKLDTLVELRHTDDLLHMIDSTIVRGHSQAAGGKGRSAKRALVEAAAAIRAKSTPAVTVRDALLASFRPAVRSRIIAPKANCREPAPCDYRRYRDRNQVEQLFNRLKQFRRIATRCDKTATSCLAFLYLAAVKVWLSHYVNRP